MRGADNQQDSLFSTVIPEERVPKDHSLRPIHDMVNKVLKELDADFYELLTSLLITVFYNYCTEENSTSHGAQLR
jgi:hypothetical protein